MSKYRTAQGKTIDMNALASRNEKIRAVGNMSVNARGDTIDSLGRVIKTASEKVNENYSNAVGNRSAQPKRMSPNQQQQVKKPAVDLSQLNEIERQLEEESDDDIDIEQIKAQETKKK